MSKTTYHTAGNPVFLSIKVGREGKFILVLNVFKQILKQQDLEMFITIKLQEKTHYLQVDVFLTTVWYSKYLDWTYEYKQLNL